MNNRLGFPLLYIRWCAYSWFVYSDYCSFILVCVSAMFSSFVCFVSLSICYFILISITQDQRGPQGYAGKAVCLSVTSHFCELKNWKYILDWHRSSNSLTTNSNNNYFKPLSALSPYTYFLRAISYSYPKPNATPPLSSRPQGISRLFHSPPSILQILFFFFFLVSLSRKLGHYHYMVPPFFSYTGINFVKSLQ